jgi:peroxiredoxin
VYLPIWLPRPPEELLAEAIAGYINVLGENAPSPGAGINTLVRFASLEVKEPLRMVQKALMATSTRSHPLSVVWVVPSGTFQRASRQELESRLERLAGEFPASLELAEDIEGGWSRTFAAGDTPSTFLLNARGEFVWKQEREEDLDGMVKALHHHLTPALAPSFKPLSLSIRRGAPVPDFEFVDQHGGRHALRRFHGQEVLLIFWQSWSAPCRKELQRYQRLHGEGSGTREAPVIVGLHGGPDAEAIHTVSKELGISFILAHDAEHRIARSLGVRCWPTSVRLGRDGALREATFGLSPDFEVSATESSTVASL